MRFYPGRYTTIYDGELVIYAFGMHINRPLRVGAWARALRATYAIRRHLRAHPECGNVGFNVALLYGGLAVVTFWRSVEDVHAFSRDPELHLRAWRWFNRAIRETGEVGMWHEMYRVAPGEYEAIYGNMPRVGLAELGDHRPVGSTSETAAQRLASKRRGAGASRAEASAGTHRTADADERSAHEQSRHEQSAHERSAHERSTPAPARISALAEAAQGAIAGAVLLWVWWALDGRGR